MHENARKSTKIITFAYRVWTSKCRDDIFGRHLVVTCTYLYLFVPKRAFCVELSDFSENDYRKNHALRDGPIKNPHEITSRKYKYSTVPHILLGNFTKFQTVPCIFQRKCRKYTLQQGFSTKNARKSTKIH